MIMKLIFNFFQNEKKPLKRLVVYYQRYLHTFKYIRRNFRLAYKTIECKKQNKTHDYDKSVVFNLQPAHITMLYNNAAVYHHTWSLCAAWQKLPLVSPTLCLSEQNGAPCRPAGPQTTTKSPDCHLDPIWKLSRTDSTTPTRQPGTNCTCKR